MIFPSEQKTNSQHQNEHEKTTRIKGGESLRITCTNITIHGGHETKTWSNITVHQDEERERQSKCRRTQWEKWECSKDLGSTYT